MSKKKKVNSPIEGPKFPNSSKGLNIYFHISENSGVGYYRQFLPAWKLREHKLANTIISDFRWGEGEHVEPDTEKLSQILNWADLVVVGRKDQSQFYAQWGALKQFFNIPVVVDTDDNVFHVRPSNPGYQGYHPGSEAITWNKYAFSKTFDAITVSTENLIEVYKKYNPKIHVLPNNLDVDWWKRCTKPKRDDGLIRIGFIASAAHPEGVYMVKDSIIAILKKYPKTRLLITQMYRPLFDGSGVESQIEAIPWINLKEWPEKYTELGIDIGLAPLADNMFNRAKSNLRWMEYCVQGIASIVSPVEAYSCVRDGVDALVAKEKNDWFACLERLITNEALRLELGKNGLARIEKEYNMDKNIGLWADTYQGIHDTYHEFFGKKKNFYIGKKGLQEFGGKRKR